jgi:polyisoprenoid-binding protein YceI
MSQTTSPARQVDGRTVPAAGTWSVDTAHSSVEFVARHLVVTKVRGRFADWSAELVIGERPEDSRVDVTIRAASVDTGDAGRNGHLVSPDFLDVERFPALTFTTTSVAPGAGDRWDVLGDLTIHGVTRPVTLAVEFAGAATDPWGTTKAAFSASTEIDREEFGLTWNQALETGGVLVGKQVRIEIEVQAAQG